MTTATLRSNDLRINNRIIATGTSAEVDAQLDRWLQIREAIGVWAVLQLGRRQWLLYTDDNRECVVLVRD